ncbi:MAG TPA: enolase C-terminal domain-like protein [Rhizomicrobium sp.]|nr:enolase C-terminal domain-like protein [Rhizomicrobium sp.]
MDRRGFLSTFAMGGLAVAPAATSAQPVQTPIAAGGVAPQKIASVEIIELRGSYDVEKGVDSQFEVTPLAVYDAYQQPDYVDKPDGTRTVKATALYLRIRCGSGLEGIYGPVDKEAATVVQDQIRPFLIGKDALAGEILWDQMYRSNRHSRDGIFLMGISAVDNTLWDLRAKAYGVPVWRLLGGPSRREIEFYASALGSSLQPDAVRKRATQLKNMGFRYQKWFMGYGPGSGEEGMRKNVELVKTLRETLGEDYEIMFDAFSGWDANYAMEWAKRVEKYRPKWIEELTHPEKIDGFVAVRRSTDIPLASGEHFYGRWEVERYLQAGTLSIVQADPEWCGGISELLKIGTVASLHDVQVIPHGHGLRASAHTIFSQSPMTFPLGEYLVLKMRDYHYFEADPPLVKQAHMALPQAPGFGIRFDDSKIQQRQIWG